MNETEKQLSSEQYIALELTKALIKNNQIKPKFADAIEEKYKLFG